MKTGEVVLAWILVTVMVCIEVALRTATAPAELTPDQIDAAQALALSIGFDTLKFYAAGVLLYIIEWITAAFLALMLVVEVVRILRLPLRRRGACRDLVTHSLPGLRPEQKCRWCKRTVADILAAHVPPSSAQEA